jgi:hypothetical protein
MKFLFAYDRHVKIPFIMNSFLLDFKATVAYFRKVVLNYVEFYFSLTRFLYERNFLYLPLSYKILVYDFKRCLCSEKLTYWLLAL